MESRNSEEVKRDRAAVPIQRLKKYRQLIVYIKIRVRKIF